MNTKGSGPNWLAQAQAMRKELVTWRRDFHMHPELGFEETRTAGIVATELKRLGYQVFTGVAHTGVIGLLAAPEGLDGWPQPVILLRFDMDCLPLQEANDVPYKSLQDGRMHACGHDGHVAIGLGVATLLAHNRDALKGTVKLMFQPGEEGLNGAKVMIDEGLLDRFGPRPEIALAAHVWNDLPLGKVSAGTGPIMAASEAWECVIKGRGGHGASPNQTADPIISAAQIINAWQTVVSRNVNPLKTAVLSVGSIHAGEAFNIIPPTVTLSGTIRTFDPDVREMVLHRFEEIATGISQSMGCSAEIEIKQLTPALVNDDKITEVVRKVAAGLVGKENILEDRTMGSEDMGFVNELIPGCYLFIGSSNKAAGLFHPHHNPNFDFDESVLPLAVGLLTTATAEFMQT